VQKEHLEVY